MWISYREYLEQIDLNLKQNNKYTTFEVSSQLKLYNIKIDLCLSFIIFQINIHSDTIILIANKTINDRHDNARKQYSSYWR